MSEEDPKTRDHPLKKEIRTMSDSSEDEHEHPPKRQRPSGPTIFVTWNANGLVSRCTWNKDELRKLVKETQAEVLSLQEVRLKAAGSSNRGTPLASDYKSIKDAMDIFSDYDKHWSLADNRYAGTLTLIHKRLRFSRQDSAFTTKSAIALLLKQYGLTRQQVGLPEPKKAPSPKKKQSTMTAFFAPKTSSKNSSNGTTSISTGEHHEEGRFQFFSFDGFDLINTYVPNNGTKEESFKRRRVWDEQIKSFFSQRKLILQKAEATGRPLLWLGDMNCAMTYRDGTHWEATRENNKNNNKQCNSDTPGFYEWWRDESQCFVRDAAKKLESNRDPGDIGIPSFTSNERIRFAEIFREGDLKDVWRALHPNGVTTTTSDNPKYKTQWDLPNWTWRGHLAKDGNQFGSKYEGKGQRLDYFLLSPSSITSSVVESCDILGYGADRLGLYCGSDHCASMLKLKNPLS